MRVDHAAPARPGRSRVSLRLLARTIALTTCLAGCTASSNATFEREERSGMVPIERSDLEPETGIWTQGPAQVAGKRLLSTWRLGLDANPRVSADKWARLRTPPGSWSLLGSLGVSDVPLVPSAVLFLEVVKDEDTVQWRGTVQPGRLVEIPSIPLPSAASSIELHAGFESARSLTFLVLVDLRLVSR